LELPLVGDQTAAYSGDLFWLIYENGTPTLAEKDEGYSSSQHGSKPHVSRSIVNLSI